MLGIHHGLLISVRAAGAAPAPPAAPAGTHAARGAPTVGAGIRAELVHTLLLRFLVVTLWRKSESSHVSLKQLLASCISNRRREVTGGGRPGSSSATSAHLARKEEFMETNGCTLRNSRGWAVYSAYGRSN